MRLQKSVSLDDNRSVTVLELRVKDARNLMTQARRLDKLPVRELLTDRFHEICELLSACLEFSDDTTLDDLTFSEVNAVKDAMLEVNAAFLGLMALTGVPVGVEIPGATDEEISTGPASS